MSEANSQPQKVFVLPRISRWAVATAFVCLIIGTALSHKIEPAVRVEQLMLATNTPALRIHPKSPGPHPIALLAHGVTASKESLFRVGEALAVAGFDCYAIDLPGHGESRQPFSIEEVKTKPAEIARALGSVDIFVGHSMGAGAGVWSVREEGFQPKLFIAFGNNAQLGEQGPPLLLLAGRFEEFLSPRKLKARTDAPVVISPWSDHVLEPFDPHLVNVAVQAACIVAGKTPPASPTAWLWRFAGLALGMAGALGLMFFLPELNSALARSRGILVPAIFVGAMVLTMGKWVGMAPNLHRLPQQVALLIILWAMLKGFERLRLRRWILPVLSAVLTVGCRIIATRFNTTFPFGLSSTCIAVATLLLCAGMVVGRIASRRGTSRDGDIAMILFASYTIGQGLPTPF